MSWKKSQTVFDEQQLYELSRWLIGYGNQDLCRWIRELTGELEDLVSQIDSIPLVVLAESNPDKFISYFFAAIISQVNLFICNPYWQEQEWKQVFDLVTPDLIWGVEIQGKPGDSKTERLETQRGIIAIPTGGSSGKVRFAVHNLNTLTASAQGFVDYFGVSPVNSCCTLPLYHVSGLMQLWRCFLTQGKLVVFPYKYLKEGDFPLIQPQDFFISLVPTQLKFLLDSYPDWLAKFKTVLLGGSPAWRSLLTQARQYHIPLSLTYGMTETASGVVYLKGENFLEGNNSSGLVLPHAQVRVIRDRHESLNEIGTIQIEAESLFLGYYPDIFPKKAFITDDLGYFDQEGFLHILGRKSQKIITGGENVFPAEVEAAILSTGLVKDVCVVGIEDNQWGQIVTAVFVAQTEEFCLDLIKYKLQSLLSKYKHPKKWLQVDSLPRCDRGKINYGEIQSRVRTS